MLYVLIRFHTFGVSTVYYSPTSVANLLCISFGFVSGAFILSHIYVYAYYILPLQIHSAYIIVIFVVLAPYAP